MAAQASRTASPLSAIFLDLDHFKSINDTYGHDRGDEVLAAVGAVLRAELRASDLAGRMGGEEFLILAPDTGRVGALEIAEKVRVALHEIRVRDLERAVTASFGVATLLEDTLESDTLLRIADRALYSAKQNGRDRVEASPAPTAPPRRGRTPACPPAPCASAAGCRPAGRACSRARRPCRPSTGSAWRGSPDGRRPASP